MDLWALGCIVGFDTDARAARTEVRQGLVNEERR
jgi:hypothetical protein